MQPLLLLPHRRRRFILYYFVIVHAYLFHLRPSRRHRRSFLSGDFPKNENKATAIFTSAIYLLVELVARVRCARFRVYTLYFNFASNILLYIIVMRNTSAPYTETDNNKINYNIISRRYYNRYTCMHLNNRREQKGFPGSVDPLGRETSVFPLRRRCYRCPPAAGRHYTLL